MKLYHGSNMTVENPVIKEKQRALDFVVANRKEITDQYAFLTKRALTLLQFKGANIGE